MREFTRYARFDIAECHGPSLAALLTRVHDLVDEVWTLSTHVPDESVESKLSERAEDLCGLIDVLRDGLTSESEVVLSQ